MQPGDGARYDDVGVLANEDLGLGALLRLVQSTEAFREGKQAGRSLVAPGYFACAIDLGHGMGLALTTDGVGTKVMVAQMLDRYDTIGIDCVAMNVNDLICIGAEPVSMLDYIAIEKASPSVLQAIGKGLHEGARLAGVNLVGGEISQIGEMLKGYKSNTGLDLVGMCVGLVPTNQINTGQHVRPGDIVIGLASSGIHSNGLTLARDVLLNRAGLKPDSRLPELGRGVGEELLEPTRIYVKEVLELLNGGLPIKAMANITGDGLLNLTRIEPAVGFRLANLPRPQPIFQAIQERGKVELAEMYRVFNMGVGFCLVVPPDSSVLTAVHETLKKHEVASFELGEVIADERRRVVLPQHGLVGEGDRFYQGTLESD